MHTVRIIFSTVVIIQALIHLIGFSKEWQIGAGSFNIKEITSFSSFRSNLTGLVWWACSLGLILSIIFYCLRKEWWWTIAIAPVCILQVLIIMNWNGAKFGTVVNVVILVAILLSYSHWKFNRMVKKETDELLNLALRKNVSLVTLESTKGLPTIVQKWLSRANVIGKEKVNTVHLKQKGRMRNKPDAKWMEFKADQYFTTSTPGFIWNASIDAGNFITIVGRDKYMNGHGNMLIKAMNLIPVANATGKEIDQGTMLRYLVEISWFPSAALDDDITWEPVDAMSARATLHDREVTVSGIFSFNAEGDIIGFEARRYRDINGKYSLETWSIRNTAYKKFNEVRIPYKSEVTWKMKAGDFTWLEVEVTDIDYNITNYN